jgi:hypothetical protein
VICWHDILRADIGIACDLIAACHPISVKVLDHLIVAENEHYSFADTELLEELSFETLASAPARHR